MMVQPTVQEWAEPLLIPHMETLRHICSVYGVSSSAECRPLCRRRNLFYLVRDWKRGRKMVLRFSGPHRSRAELSAEALWLCELQKETGLLVPRPLQTEAGAFCVPLPGTPPRSYCMAFDFLPGTPQQLENSRLKMLFHHLGEMTTQLHQNVILWSGASRLQRPVIDCDAVDPAVFVSLAEGKIFSGAFEKVKARLKAFGRSPDRFGLIHADLKPENLLLYGSRLVLLHFDQCSYGWFLYDFAASAAGFETHPLLPELMQAWLEGYRRHRKLSREEERALPTFLMLRRLIGLSRKLERGEVSSAFLQETADLAGSYLHAK